jgi:hypothetical protein
MSQAARFHETLRRLAMIDEGFVIGEAGLGLGVARTSALDPRTAALLQVAASVACGSRDPWTTAAFDSTARSISP